MKLFRKAFSGHLQWLADLFGHQVYLSHQPLKLQSMSIPMSAECHQLSSAVSDSVTSSSSSGRTGASAITVVSRLIWKYDINCHIINRPGVAAAVLQIPSSFIIHSFIKWPFSQNIFKTPSLPSRKKYGPDILRECSPPTICHMSHVMCHTQMLHVMCPVSHVTFFFTKWWS